MFNRLDTILACDSQPPSQPASTDRAHVRQTLGRLIVGDELSSSINRPRDQLASNQMFTSNNVHDYCKTLCGFYVCNSIKTQNK